MASSTAVVRRLRADIHTTHQLQAYNSLGIEVHVMEDTTELHKLAVELSQWESSVHAKIEAWKKTHPQLVTQVQEAVKLAHVIGGINAVIKHEGGVKQTLDKLKSIVSKMSPIAKGVYDKVRPLFESVIKENGPLYGWANEIAHHPQMAAIKTTLADIKTALTSKIGALLQKGAVDSKEVGEASTVIGGFLTKIKAIPGLGQKIASIEGFTSKTFKGFQVLKSPAFAKVVAVASFLISGVEGWVTSPAQTTAGKGTDAAVAGGTSVLMMANPWIALADMVTPHKYNLSTIFKGGAHEAGAIVDAVASGKWEGLEKVNDDNLAGRNGYFLQQAAQSGDYWAKHGFVGTMKEFGSALTSLWK